MEATRSALTQLTDAQLLAEVRRLAARECEATAALVASLGELDSRKLYLREGYSSLFTYCTKALRLSESAAYCRIEASRAAARYPQILDRLARGAVTLTAVKLLAPHLTDENCTWVLDAASGASKAAIEELVARLRPRPDAPAFVRKLPGHRGATVAPLSAAAGASGPQPAAGRTMAGVLATTRCSSGSVGVRSPGGTEHFGETLGGKRGCADDRPTLDLLEAPNDRRVIETGDRASAVLTTVDVSALHGEHVGGGERAVAETPAASGGEAGPPVADECLPPITLTAPDSVTPSAWNAAPARAATVVPLAPDRYKVQMTVSGETRAKLRRAQDLLRHSIPNGDVAVIFDRALTLLVEHLERSKHAALKRGRKGTACRTSPGPTDAGRNDQADCSEREQVLRAGEQQRASEAPGSPQAQQPRVMTEDSSGEDVSGQQLVPEPVLLPNGNVGSAKCARRSRHIPAAIRREVWARDAGRCTYVGRHGRCGQTAFLEYHHVVPFAAGGETSVSNLRLACVAHNRLEAERFFGEDVIATRGPSPGNSSGT